MLPSLTFIDAAPHWLLMCFWSITEYMHTSSWNSQSSSNSITARPQNVTQSIPLALVTHHVRLHTMGQLKVTNSALVVFKCLWIFFSWTCICLCSQTPCCIVTDFLTYTSSVTFAITVTGVLKTGCKSVCSVCSLLGGVQESQSKVIKGINTQTETMQFHNN